MDMKLQVSKRGGIREPIKNKSGPSRLLEILWNNYGGPVALGHDLKVSTSVVINWRVRGKVPLKLVPKVGEVLGVPHFGLNYADLVKFYGAKAWEDVVKSYKLTPDEINWILKGKRPKE